MELTEYVQYDGLGLADLVRRGEVAGDEPADCARRAIDAVNDRLNAVIGIFDSPDRDPAAGPDVPFAGVPFLIKDLVLHRAGGECEMGSRLARGLVAPHDTVLMERFRAAGLVTMGRTNTPEFGHACTTEPVLHGPTRNPWDTTRMSGGSSGGSAAAVAAGIVPLAHGNDGAGSIRNPAACCGLFGLKPTRGRVSAGPDYGEALLGNACELVLSRTVRDTAAALDAVAGPAPGDPNVAPPPATPYLAAIETPPERLRIAVATEAWSGAPIEAGIAAAVGRAAALCQDLGHDVEDASPRFDYEQFRRASIRAWAIFVAAGVEALVEATGRRPSPDTLEAATFAMYERGRSLSGLDLVAAMADFNAVCRAVGPFFETYDVLLTPVTSRPPQPLGTYDQNRAGITPEGWFDHKGAFTPFLALFNATGQPAMSVPLATGAGGLPVGIQFAGRFGDEATLLALARQLERAAPWAGRHPPVWCGG